MIENETTEFKLTATDAVYKEVIAFANSNGGTIYVGVDDRGNSVGLPDIDETYTKLTNGIRDAILPDVTMFVKYVLTDENVIQITVNEGMYKPYYLKAKGLRAGGVYVRQGASCAPASGEQIRALIKASDGDIFEEGRSLEQNLSFSAAKNAFHRYDVDFSEEKYRNLGIVNGNDGLYTNLALLLSDQCPYTTKIAVFADEDNTVFRASRQFGGSVFEQLDQTFAFLMLNNKNAATFQGLNRVDKWDYPETALREALLNALVHRDYNFSGSIIINENEKETEFISIGGLLPGLSAEDIKNGISQPRNKRLAEVFHRLRLIESYGTGIRRIFHLYKDCPAQPRLEITQNSFKLVLPNMNYQTQPPHPESASKSALQMHAVLSFLSENGSASIEEIQDLLGVKKTRAYMILKNMSENQMIFSKGKGADRKYFAL